MEAAMDTDEAGELSIEPEKMQYENAIRYSSWKMQYVIHRWGYTLKCDRVFISWTLNTLTNKEITVCFFEIPKTYISLANLF